MDNQQPSSGARIAVLLVGDVLALALFVLLGERDHAIADPQPVLRWLVTTAEFAVPWVMVAFILGAYAQGLSLKTFIGRSVNAWFVAAPLGLLLRSFVNGEGVIISIFMVVAMCIGGCLLMAWRLIFRWLWRGRTARVQPGTQTKTQA